MATTHIPTHTQVLVIGGGPAGSYAACALAREGMQVVLLEAVQFPRYHIGESLIPSVRHYLRFIDAEEKLVGYGFKHKPGAALKLNQYKREGYTDFMAIGHSNSSWNVTRSDFDKLLLDHAKESGVRVYEHTRATSLRFADSSQPGSRPTSAQWRRSRPEDCSNHSGEISFDFLVDASGRVGLLSNRYMKNRHYNDSLRNVALWGYWTGVGTYGLGTPREGAPWFEALTDDSGWAWFIPLHNDTSSVGVVVNQERYQEWCKAHPDTSTLVRYHTLLSLAPNLLRLIGEGTFIAKPLENGNSANTHLVRSAADFSYSAPVYAGDGFRIVGDAGAFIDPLFSSGVHLAMTSALSAAASICASIRGDCSETAAAAWHTSRFRLSYTRFQMIVLSAYKQIRATRFDVLNDVDEDGYERTFTAIRPVIQGASDMGTRLSEQELQNALDYCSKFVHPTSPRLRPEEKHELGTSESPARIAGLMPVMTEEQANARRLVHQEYLVHNLEAEEINGLVVRLRKGSLGLSRVTMD